MRLACSCSVLVGSWRSQLPNPSARPRERSLLPRYPQGALLLPGNIVIPRPSHKLVWVPPRLCYNILCLHPRTGASRFVVVNANLRWTVGRVRGGCGMDATAAPARHSGGPAGGGRGTVSGTPTLDRGRRGCLERAANGRYLPPCGPGPSGAAVPHRWAWRVMSDRIGTSVSRWPGALPFRAAPARCGTLAPIGLRRRSEEHIHGCRPSGNHNI